MADNQWRYLDFTRIVPLMLDPVMDVVDGLLEPLGAGLNGFLVGGCGLDLQLLHPTSTITSQEAAVA